jgi:hypothetical protein
MSIFGARDLFRMQKLENTNEKQLFHAIELMGTRQDDMYREPAVQRNKK